jgi:hypothetical protein
MAIVLDGTNGITSSGSLSFGANAGTVGINFNNNTSGVGTEALLNDYETGTWTPNQGSGLTVTGTFASNGSYTKIGRMVLINFRMTATTLTAAGGNIICSNAPFSAPGDSTGFYGAGTSGAGNVNNIFETYVGNIYTVTTLSGTNVIYGSIVFQATF